MARPRVFVSSTYYDLRHIRNGMEDFIESLGYDPVLFESGDIAFHFDMTLAEACYNEVKNSHIFVLIIGGRYGSADVERKKSNDTTTLQKMYEAYNSVTRKEYETAREKDIPIFIFVDKNVKAEYETFKSNRDNSSIKYAHVDSVNIFRLLDNILNQERNNFVREFDKFEDITFWLREQWAGIFADLLIRKKESSTLRDMAARMLELNQVTNSLKEYTETILKKVVPTSQPLIDREEAKQYRSKILAFREEPLIKYLRERPEIVGDGDILPPIGKWYDLLEESKNLEDFLNAVNVKEGIQNMLLVGRSRNAANGDFASMKRRFFGQEVEEQEGPQEEDPDVHNDGW